MPLASIQRIVSVEKHPNADTLDIVGVLGYKAIVKRDQWKIGDLCVFVLPDSVLPDVSWAAFYRAKSSRIRAIKLRNRWSEGVVESVVNIGYTGPIEEGLDISEVLQVTKYSPPEPQDLSAKGLLPLGIPKTDEERVESLEGIPYGEVVDVFLKVDGQSASYYWYVDSDKQVHEGVLGRTMEYKSDARNNYTQNAANLDILNKLSYFCRSHALNGICVRGESHGHGIQKFVLNPHAKIPLNWAMFSVWLVEERRYARKGDPYYFLTIADEIRLPTVPVIERDVVLTPELVVKYADGDTLNGQPYEGVVIQWRGGSFKVICRHYDSRK